MSNKSATEDNAGHKWSFHALRDYFTLQEIDSDAVFEAMHEVIIKTLISAEAPIASNCNRFIPNRGNVFEMFGFGKLLKLPS